MTTAPFLQSLAGPFHFLRPSEEEIRRLWPAASQPLPEPQRIFLRAEEATPLLGFPILITEHLKSLAHALQTWILTEEQRQILRALRHPVEHAVSEQAWERYQAMLTAAIENVTYSSYGRPFPDVFWLHHSQILARLLKDTPTRCTKQDSQIDRKTGDAIRYRVLHRYLDSTISLVYDIASRIAHDTEQDEQRLFPRLLNRMRDNVLILTEDRIGWGLHELGSYFQGMLHVDGQDFRKRLRAFDTWHEAVLRDDPMARATAAHLLAEADAKAWSRGRSLSGYLELLAKHPRYEASRLLSPNQVRVWESLLVKLKEFELLHALRSLIIPVVAKEDHFVCHDPQAALGDGEPLRLSTATRPIDFMTAWVVDPLVERFGMIYDITDFTQTISQLRRSPSAIQDRSFRRMVRFQRRVNRLAARHKAQLEKYLGDGAFYSCRHAGRLLHVAVSTQRYYRAALDEGFSFDRGMRIALNYGRYRLIPIQGMEPGQERYEFFGHGIVELSRLTSGKKSREIEDLQHLLVTRGYSEAAVVKFFAPLSEKGVDVVDRVQEERSFYAYINENDSLVNEGIVATSSFLRRLVEESEIGACSLAPWSGTSFVIFELELGGDRLEVGIRKLGLASLKGMDELLVYEIVDGCDLPDREELDAPDLLHAIERQFALEHSGSVV